MVENSKSGLRPIECGLLQGDNLSQNFFSIVINEIVVSIKNCHMHLYADDLMIYKDCDLRNLNETINMVNSVIENIGRWMNEHGMD